VLIRQIAVSNPYNENCVVYGTKHFHLAFHDKLQSKHMWVLFQCPLPIQEKCYLFHTHC
jgi:hypothetical protein